MDAINGIIIAPDFLALGLGGTNMMAMLWTVVGKPAGTSTSIVKQNILHIARTA